MRIRIRPTAGMPGGFFVYLFFQLVFMGAGGLAFGYAIWQYQQGAAMSQVYVFGGVGALFVVLSAFQVVRAWRRRQQAGPAEQREQQAEAPWRVRPEWRQPEMVEKGGWDWKTGMMALVWNGFSWPLAAYFLVIEWQSASPEWSVLLVVIFPLVGIGLAWMALRGVLHRRKFGATTLVMEDMPGRLGRPLQMRMRTGVAQHDAPEDGFHARLSCYRRSVRYTTDSDGDRRREVKKNLLWRDEKRVRGRTYGGHNRIEVPVTFELPTDAPPSTPEERAERIMWEVEVDGEVPGLDFQSAFEIPVFPPDEAPNGSDQNGEEAPARESTAADEAEPASNPYAGYELGTELTEPVSPGITMQRSPRGGLQLHFAAGRNKGSALLLTGLAVVMGAGSVLVFTQSILGALLCGVFAGITGYGAWTQWTATSTLTIEQGTVTLVRGAFGRGTPTSFPCTDLADVTIEANGHAGNITYYDLVLHRLEPAAQQHAASNAGAAEQVAQFLQSTGLVANGPDADRTMKQIKQAIHEHGTQLKVAGGLSNKQEADWIAATIQQAAQREAQFA